MGVGGRVVKRSVAPTHLLHRLVGRCKGEVGSRDSHQNRACKYYKLTSDNNGEAFRWTSNYQIISKVYLKKHSSLPLCYSLSAADKKMVTSTMKKMVGPEAE